MPRVTSKIPTNLHPTQDLRILVINLKGTSSYRVECEAGRNKN